uniref:DNA repair protein RAD50 isoform X2 n=1 Tax=Nicotiana tabacum TaxID=4097 RepID=A0A1S3X4W0_TOBAC|nr:PREDICTED: DNA repair protein RAD50-like isoform X2 [Nicotiana tabacum]
MDREIPALMGVSKAILENVIFVHQDEANWPLQDPSTLKKKFDDIFSATRYTKALEVIKKLHKDQAQEIKTYKLKLENLQTLKDAAYKLRESIAQDKEKTESLKSQMEELEKEIRTLESKIHHTEATLKDLHQLQREIATKTAERKTLFNEQEKQYAALAEENEDTDEELSEWKTKFDERIALLELKISKLEREMNDSETKSSLLKQSMTDYIVEISKLQAEAEALAVLKNERDVIIRKLFGRHNLGAVPSGPLSDDVTLNLMNRINLRLAHLDKDLQDKKETNEAEIAAAWHQYEIANNLWNEKEAQKVARADIKNGILKRIEEKENERNEFEREISNVNMAHLDEREKKMQIECERKSKQLAEREFDSNIRQKQTEMFTIDQKLKDLHAEKDRMANESEDRIKLSLKKAELETLKKKHKKLMDDNKDKVKGVLKGRLPSDKDLKKEITQAQSKYNIADGMRQMFDPFERVARAHHICPCCERPFSAEEEDEFVKKQRVKAASSAEHIKVLAMDSSNADSRFQQLDKLRLVYEEYLKVGKESIPLAEKNLSELNEELDQKNQSLDDVLGVLAQIKAEKDAVDALIQPVETSDRLFQEIQALQKQVDDLDYGLDIRGQGVRSMEEIQSELDELQSKRENLSSEVEKLKDDRRYMENEFSSFQLRWFTVREEKAQAANKLNNVKRAEEELDDLVEQKNKVELEEKHLAEAVGPLSKEKDKHFRDYQNLKTKLSKELEEQAEIRRHYQQDVDELKKITSKIREYYELKKEQKLNELQDKRSLSESQLQNCESRKQEISAEVAKSKALMQNQDNLRRNIEDNLNYRKTKADVDKLTCEIELLEDKVLKMGGLSTIEAELKRLSHEREKLLSELNKCHGTLSVYQSSISKNKVDLKQPQYKDIDKRYFDQLIQLKTTEMANKDLDRYYNALDKALMRFHTMKMEEINKIIRELWQQTYRGQDIDYISIHSDSEGSGTRSYSYRVLMQTGDTELEMRGRCSAGQKVLASLIIRLALAETFCLNCGILALDEPTTNLDGPNSESLAAALLRIMEDRKGQENFQLIVITHDERFAQYIGQRQHAEKYYRITKDDHQHSIIEAQEIFD